MATINYFKTVEDHLGSIHGKCSAKEAKYYVRGWQLEFRSLRMIYVCITKLGKGVGRCESAGLLVEDVVLKCAPNVESVCLQLLGDDQLTSSAIQDDLLPSLAEFLEGIQFLSEEFEQLCLICSDRTLQESPLLEDDEELLDLINSLLEFFEYLQGEKLDALDRSLRFLKSLIHFAAFRGLHHNQMENLFTLTQLLSYFSSDQHALDVPSKISQLLRTISPVQPHVHEIYVHVLLASTSSPSAHTLTPTPTPTPGSYKTTLGNFIDSIKHKLWQLLDSSADSLVSFNYQMLKLHEELIFLRAIIREHQNKFDDLYQTRHDLIGVVICEAGILICLLFRESNEQGLVKDLDSMFSDLFNKIKLIKAEATEIYPIISQLSFPRTNMSGLVDSDRPNLE